MAINISEIYYNGKKKSGQTMKVTNLNHKLEKCAEKSEIKSETGAACHMKMRVHNNLNKKPNFCQYEEYWKEKKTG